MPRWRNWYTRSVEVAVIIDLEGSSPSLGTKKKVDIWANCSYSHNIERSRNTMFSVSKGDRKAEVVECAEGYIVRFFVFERLYKVIHVTQHSVFYVEDMAENWVSRVIN